MANSSSAFPSLEMKRFTVITTDLLKQDDRAAILTALATMRSGTQARTHALSKGFTTDVLDNHGRVVVLRWRGVEVALLFKRAVQRIEIAPAEPTPTVHIADQEQAWTQFNLLGIRHDQELAALQQRTINAEQSLNHTAALLTRVAQEAEQKGNVLLDLERQIDALAAELEQYHQAEKKSSTLPDGRQLLVKVKYKTRTKIVQASAKKKAKPAPAPVKKAVKKATPKKSAKKKGKKP